MDRMYKKIGRRLLSLVLVTSMLLTGSYLGSMADENSTTELEVAWSRSREPATVTANAAKWSNAGSELGTVQINNKNYSYKSYDSDYWILKRNSNYYFSKKSQGSTRPSGNLVSSYKVTGTIATGVPQAGWGWSVAGTIETPVTDKEQVWDSGTDYQYYDGYASQGTDFKAATWKLQTEGASGEKGTADLRRFTGSFTLPADFDPADTILYRSVNQSSYSKINNGNIIPINDDIFIFCYPKDKAELINDDPDSDYYFLNYLVFWSGTAAQYEGKTFHGIASNEAKWDQGNDKLELTDGWYVKADPDNIGTAIFQNGEVPAAGDEYVIDIFTDDYAGGGGMDMPQILVSRSNNLRVVAEDDSYIASKLAPAQLDILKNDKVYRRDQAVSSQGLAATDFTGYGSTTLTPAGGGYTVKVGDVAAGTLTVGADGTGSFAPADGFTGEVQFQYTAWISDNGVIREDDAVVTIKVNPESVSDLVDMSKTAHVIDWFNRTYDITLTAEAKTSSSTVDAAARDIVLVLDSSGSMAWGGTEYYHPSNKTLGTFRNVKDSLDTTKKYYYYCEETEGYWSSSSPQSPNGNRLEYRGGKWQKYVDTGIIFSNWEWVDVSDTDTVYARNDRLCQLKDAVNQFIDQVAAKSPESRIAVVYFNSDASDETSKTFYKLNTAANITTLKQAVNGERAGGSTYLGDGLEVVNDDYFKNAPGASDNKRMVVTFTDGALNGNNYATQASTLKTTKKAEIYCVGLYLTDSATTILKNYVASPDKEGDKVSHVMNTADADKLAGLFDQIVSVIGGTVEGVTVTDVLDSRFELTEGEKARLEAEGAIVTVADGVTTITWRKQTVKTGDEKWTKVIHVKAKDSYIGGNNIPTNDAPQSGVTIDGQFEEFPHQPSVNVKIRLSLNDVEKTVFLGESAPAPADVQPQMQTSSDRRISYAWDVADPEAAITPASVDDVVSRLTATVPGGGRTQAADDNTDGYYNESVVSVTGTYTVHVIAGSLTIVKNLVNDTPADTATPFVFRVDRYDEQGEIVETFYRTIYTNDGGTGSVTVTGLKKGRYVVTEQADWSWKYKLVSSSGTDGTLGMEDGYTDTAMTAAFNNEKDKDNWYGSTDGVINVFTK